MAGTKLLLDAGPLLAYFDAQDQWHKWAVPRWHALKLPFYTCEAILSECVFLLEDSRLSIEPLLSAIERGAILVDFSMMEQQADVLRLLRKYADQPMSLADACLVRMSELSEAVQVFTTDRDFRTYRRRGRDLIPQISPFD